MTARQEVTSCTIPEYHEEDRRPREDDIDVQMKPKAQPTEVPSVECWLASSQQPLSDQAETPPPMDQAPPTMDQAPPILDNPSAIPSHTATETSWNFTIFNHILLYIRLFPLLPPLHTHTHTLWQTHTLTHFKIIFVQINVNK